RELRTAGCPGSVALDRDPYSRRTRRWRAVDAQLFFQFFANGLSFGAILALSAIGLTLVYGILNLSNFAHGDFLTFGAYMAFFFGAGAAALGAPEIRPAMAPLGVALGAALVAAGLVGWRALGRLRQTEGLALAGFGAALA